MQWCDWVQYGNNIHKVQFAKLKGETLRGQTLKKIVVKLQPRTICCVDRVRCLKTHSHTIH
jgi:hypothetical protein